MADFRCFLLGREGGLGHVEIIDTADSDPFGIEPGSGLGLWLGEQVAIRQTQMPSRGEVILAD